MAIVEKVVVRRTAFDNADPWEIVDALSAFAGDVGRKGLSADDLPPEVLWNSQVTNAFTQINRNGPSLYLYNVLAPLDGTDQWERLVAATRNGLNALGDVPQIQAYNDIIASYHLHRTSIVAGRKANQHFKLTNDSELYSKFMPSSEAEDKFMELRAEWVRRLPILEVVADDKYAARIEQVGEANPGRAERKATLAAAIDDEARVTEAFRRQQALLKAKMRSEAAVVGQKRSWLDKLLGR